MGGFFSEYLSSEVAGETQKKVASLPRDNRPVLARAQQGMIGIVDKAVGKCFIQ